MSFDALHTMSRGWQINESPWWKNTRQMKRNVKRQENDHKHLKQHYMMGDHSMVKWDHHFRIGTSSTMLLHKVVAQKCLLWWKFVKRPWLAFTSCLNKTGGKKCSLLISRHRIIAVSVTMGMRCLSVWGELLFCSSGQHSLANWDTASISRGSYLKTCGIVIWYESTSLTQEDWRVVVCDIIREPEDIFTGAVNLICVGWVKCTGRYDVFRIGDK